MRFPPLPPAPIAPPFIQGAEAEQEQYAHARQAFAVSMAGQPVANTRLSGRAVRRPTWWDARSPQIFVTHPAIHDAIATSATGYVTATPHLPGRLSAAGWDGESGPTAPAITGVI
jgi:hypothetical protein